MSSPDPFWQLKLAALLHDAPDKTLDIARHEEIAATYMSIAGLDASTADRVAWAPLDPPRQSLRL